MRTMNSLKFLAFLLILLAGGFAVNISYKEENTRALDDIARIATLEAKVIEQRNTITAYQRALIGEEQDLLSMYDSVQPAGQIDIVVHGETKSGLPVKFILDCGGRKQ